MSINHDKKVEFLFVFFSSSRMINERRKTARNRSIDLINQYSFLDFDDDRQVFNSIIQLTVERMAEPVEFRFSFRSFPADDRPNT